MTIRRNQALIVATVAIMVSSGGFVLTAQAHHTGNECGRASWYALTSQTASGEMMDPSKMTAAHKTLPFGTQVEVTDRRTGRSVTVRINDRGPFIRGRIIDISKEAARRLGMVRSGVVSVCIRRLR